MISITNPGSVKYPEKFKVGDFAIAKKTIRFSDRTSHFAGQKYIVTEKNVSYFNVNHEDYDRNIETLKGLDELCT